MHAGFRTGWDGVVPVERIELPTFGLQNRCSTAELNRQTRFNQSTSQMFRRTGPVGGVKPDRARRQIPELSGKGYSHKTGLSCGIIVGWWRWQRNGPASPHRAGRRVGDLTGRIDRRPLDRLRRGKPCPRHGDLAGVLRG
jgi:hypothetical protein